MPSNKNPSAPNELKKQNSLKILKKGFNFSSFHLAVFVAVFAAIGGAILLSSLAASPPAQTSIGSNETQMLIRFKTDATKDQQDKIFQDNNIRQVKEISQIRVKVVRVPANTASTVTKALSHNPAVDFIEQDQVVKPQENLPDDPYFNSSGCCALDGGAWGWTSSASHTSEAWDITQGDPRIVIAILDTGIKTAGLDDFNGQISSTWNVMNNSTDATTNAGVHGTYVAGVAGLAANNGIGNAGYCPKCKLMIVQVGTDSAGATFSNLAAGMTYAADHGAKIINMSFGGSTISATEQSAATYAHNKGVIMFAAAGNSNCDCKTYPSGDPYVHGVAGYANGGTYAKQGDSNYGTWVQYAAPEGNMTAWPTLNGQPGYGGVGGTSVASPAAAGMAALVWSANPSLSASQVEQALQNSTTPVAFTVAYGALNPFAALQSLGFSDPQPSSAPIQAVSPKIYYSVNGKTAIAPLQSAPQVGQVLIRGYGGWTGSSPLSTTSEAWYKCDTAGASCTKLPNDDLYTGPYQHTIQSGEAGYRIKFSFSMKNGLGTIPASVLSDVVGGASSGPVPGDINGDGHVDVLDLSNLLSNYGTANAAADINKDGTVGILDLSILLSNYGK